ncbi:ABC transporter ATP-binding protein [Chlorogloea sp. CCALA 695]|uniref:ABC transporter ATP-binding protein n=1 Tax=Chlorogloea sp. CCALA 695 TaxID=2107693 RepID=UPI000D058520|nr:ATP-binding cassette domain-containing protein [Chlorogloea sp. CCALA 695]PSB31804.1 cobalt ABC transporter [Chlorogloea sp. CCALA 695]
MQTAQLSLDKVSLSASVGSQYLLKDISFEIAKTELICLIGASGAGKTSLLRLLNRLSEPSVGTIYLEGQDYRSIPVIQLRQQIVLVQQESKLLGMTVKEALAYPLSLRGLEKAQIQQRILYWSDQLHIPQEWLERTEVQLSVGQRQTVAIARALVIQPKILLLDEPTSALDAGRASQLLQVLTNLAAAGETTIVMVNHQLELAQAFCQRLLYLQQGQLIQDSINNSTLDWVKLKDRLVQTEIKAAEDWN